MPVNFTSKFSKMRAAIRKFRSDKGRFGYLRRFPAERRPHEDGYYLGFCAQMGRILRMLDAYDGLLDQGQDRISRERKYTRQKILDIWLRVDKNIKWRIKTYGVSLVSRLRQLASAPVRQLEETLAKAAAPSSDDLDDAFGWQDSTFGESEGGDTFGRWQRKSEGL